MSSLQEMQNISRELSPEVNKKIKDFLAANNGKYFLSDVYYNPNVWQEMEQWNPEQVKYGNNLKPIGKPKTLIEDDPLSNKNLGKLMKQYGGNENLVLDHLRKNSKDLGVSNSDLQAIVEQFANRGW